MRIPEVRERRTAWRVGERPHAVAEPHDVEAARIGHEPDLTAFGPDDRPRRSPEHTERHTRVVIAELNWPFRVADVKDPQARPEPRARQDRGVVEAVRRAVVDAVAEAV